MGPTAESPFVQSVIDWFDEHERDLPWRGTTPWGVLVSEFMLQQTPADRVIPVWHRWLERWPRPDDLAAATLAEALREWGRLGYPRRAARLHATAIVLVERFGGRVPHGRAELLSLPGVGDYTAAAVQAFAFRQRSIVLDTNIRRVLARAVDGRAHPTDHITSIERARSESLWPATDTRSARWSAAVMELGALVCTARSPACGRCPVATDCRWLAAGRPDDGSSRRRQAAYEGSNRHARGRILAVLRAGTATRRDLRSAWPDAEQGARALDSLVRDGLAVRLPRGRYGLPGEAAS